MSKIYDELQRVMSTNNPGELLDFLDKLKVSTPWYGGRKLILIDDANHSSGSLAIRHIATALLKNKQMITETARGKIIKFSQIAENELNNAKGIAGWFKRFGTWWRQFANIFFGYSQEKALKDIQKALPAEHPEGETKYWTDRFNKIASDSSKSTRVRAQEIEDSVTGYLHDRTYLKEGPLKEISSKEVKAQVEQDLEGTTFQQTLKSATTGNTASTKTFADAVRQASGEKENKASGYNFAQAVKAASDSSPAPAHKSFAESMSAASAETSKQEAVQKQTVSNTFTREQMRQWVESKLDKELPSHSYRPKQDYLDEITELDDETLQKVQKILNEIIEGYQSKKGNRLMEITQGKYVLQVRLKLENVKDPQQYKFSQECQFVQNTIDFQNGNRTKTILSDIFPLSPLTFTAMIAGCLNSVYEGRNIMLDNPGSRNNHYMHTFVDTCTKEREEKEKTSKT